ncbi:MAG: pyridoxal phosphate-dependent aminotransferase [Sphingobacteriales bacterium]|nr:pyridoxal phosphate-dependent aminotransferase [Sphingobacteriales bacterium]
MAQLSRQLISEGKDVINLSIGEPDFNTPDHIKSAAIEAINKNITHYPPVPGFPELRKAIAALYKKDFGIEFDFNQVIVSNGAKQSLSNAILSLLDEGDEAIVPSPYWVSYPEMIKLAGAEMVVIKARMENNFKITPEELESAITPKTRMFLFSSPSNPSGSVYCLEELENLAKVFRKYPDIVIIADEIYDYINFSGNRCTFAQITDLLDRMVIINGVSKGFAMTGWRIGYMIAPLPLARACNKLQGQLTSGACTISQMAALAAYTQDIYPTLQMKNEFLKRGKIVSQKLSEIPGIKANNPEGAFYSLIDVSGFFGKSDGKRTILNSNDMAMYLLEEAYVSTVSGDAFGVPECIRISFATSEENIVKAIDKMKTAFSRLS